MRKESVEKQMKSGLGTGLTRFDIRGVSELGPGYNIDTYLDRSATIITPYGFRLLKPQFILTFTFTDFDFMVKGTRVCVRYAFLIELGLIVSVFMWTLGQINFQNNRSFFTMAVCSEGLIRTLALASEFGFTLASIRRVTSFDDFYYCGIPFKGLSSASLWGVHRRLNNFIANNSEADPVFSSLIHYVQYDKEER